MPTWEAQGQKSSSSDLLVKVESEIGSPETSKDPYREEKSHLSPFCEDGTFNLRAAANIATDHRWHGGGQT